MRRYWPNLPTTSPQQAAFLLLDQLEAFYGGAAGGGKSDALLAAALQYVDVPGYAALILRRTFRQLDQPDAIMSRSKEWLMTSDAGWSDDAKRWTFPSGATLTFGYLDNEKDKYNYQGPAYQFVGWDELTQFQEKDYTYLFSRTRRRQDLKKLGVPIRHRSASNPGGVGHGWVKRRFIDQPEPGVVFIPAKVADNPGLDTEEYAKSLDQLDAVLRAQLLDGDWGAFEGAAFPAFDDTVHCVPAFPVPEHWTRFESLDHGLSNPTVCLAWAADTDDNLVVFDSYYSERNQLISDHAAALSLLREEWWPKDAQGWNTQSPVCYADHDLWATTGRLNGWGQPAALVDDYADAGLDGFVRAAKGRKEGRSRVLELLKPQPDRPFPAWHPLAGEVGAPRLFIVSDHAPELVEQLKAAPTNMEPVGQAIGAGEAVDPKWESAYGHAVAALRYGAMSRTEPAAPVKKVVDDPREAAVQRMFQRDLQDPDLDDLGL